jgi:hypothetical protein
MNSSRGLAKKNQPSPQCVRGPDSTVLPNRKNGNTPFKKQEIYVLAEKGIAATEKVKRMSKI